MDEGKTVDTVLLDFSKTFYTDPHEIVLDKLLRYGLEEETHQVQERH